MRHSIEQIEIAARPTSQLSFQHLIKLVKSIHLKKKYVLLVKATNRMKLDVSKDIQFNVIISLIC